MRHLLAAVVVLGLGSTAYADEVTLRRGGKIKDCIATVKEGKVVVEVGSGTLTFAEKDVMAVQESPCALKEYPGKFEAVKASTKADDFVKLAAWCQEKGIGRHVRGLYQKAMALDGNNEAARKGLGYVKHEGKWMTPDEAKKAQGMVKYEGQWMTPIEAELAKAKRLEEAERKMAERAARAQRLREAQEAAALAAQEAADHAMEMQRIAAMNEMMFPRRRWRVPMYGHGRWGGGWTVDTFDVVGFLQSKGYLPK